MCIKEKAGRRRCRGTKKSFNHQGLPPVLIDNVEFQALKGSHENAKPIPRRKKNRKRGY